MAYNGLGSCVLDNRSYKNESRTSRDDGFPTSSLDDDASSCSSGKDTFSSFSSKRLSSKKDDLNRKVDDWEPTGSPQHFYVKEVPAYTVKSADVETMKEKFAKLLLGEDTKGGKNGLSTALALSNAISNSAGIP